MRLAVSGTHKVGKSTLIEDVISRLKNYESVDEPYYLLEEDGYEFPAVPTLEDFVEQLKKSLHLLNDDRKNLIFDRSPLDLLAYALCCEDADSFDLDEWMPKIQKALKSLDLIVYIPIEANVTLTKAQDDDLRYDVDEKLADILLDNSLDLEFEVIEVTGSRDQRTEQLLRSLS